MNETIQFKRWTCEQPKQLNPHKIRGPNLVSVSSARGLGSCSHSNEWEGRELEESLASEKRKKASQRLAVRRIANALSRIGKVRSHEKCVLNNGVRDTPIIVENGSTIIEASLLCHSFICLCYYELSSYGKLIYKNYYLNIFIINPGRIMLSYFLFHVEKYLC